MTKRDMFWWTIAAFSVITGIYAANYFFPLKKQHIINSDIQVDTIYFNRVTDLVIKAEDKTYPLISDGINIYIVQKDALVPFVLDTSKTKLMEVKDSL